MCIAHHPLQVQNILPNILHSNKNVFYDNVLPCKPLEQGGVFGPTILAPYTDRADLKMLLGLILLRTFLFIHFNAQICHSEPIHSVTSAENPTYYSTPLIPTYFIY